MDNKKAQDHAYQIYYDVHKTIYCVLFLLSFFINLGFKYRFLNPSQKQYRD